MKKIRFLLFSLMILIVGFANAQHNLMPGYIITNDHDTIHGLLKYDRDVKLTNRVLFYENKKTKNPKIFTPSEIKGFSYSNNRTFISIQDKIDSSLVFAKRTVTGKINMYVADLKNPESFNIFLFRSDIALMVELTPPSKSIVKKDYRTYQYLDKEYIGKIAYLTDNQKPGNKLNLLKYKQKNIKKYILSYNDEFADIYPVSAYKDSTLYSIDILGGLPIIFKQEVTHYRVSMYVDRTLMENLPNLSFRMGASYRYFNAKEETDVGSNCFWELQKRHMISILPLGGRFQFNTGKVVPYAYFLIGLGISIEYSLTFSDKFIDYYPVFNAGIGVKFRINRNNFILFEITPTDCQGFFMNLGFSF